MELNKEGNYITITPYPFDYTWLHVIRGFKEARLFFKEHLGEDLNHFLPERKAQIDGVTIWLDDQGGQRFYIIILPVRYNDTLTAHEAEHFVFNVLEDGGVPISAENSEIFCYLRDYVHKQIKKSLYSKKIKNESINNSKELI